MRHILIALLLGLAMLFSVPAANAGGKVKCEAHMKRDQHHFRRSTATGIVHYRVCRKNGQAWVRLDSAIGVINHESRRLKCGWEQAWEGAKFRFYFADNRGRNHRTSEKRAGCEADSKNSVMWNLSNAPRLYFQEGAPRWKANVTEVWSWGIPDNDGVVSGRLRAK